MLAHDSIKPRVWSRREVPNLSDSSLAGCAPVLGFIALMLGPFGLARRALKAHPVKLDSDNRFSDLAPRGETKPVGLSESFGAPPQTPGQLHRKNVLAGG